jgi:hypothetical protein
MKYILFFLLLNQPLFAGREFVNWQPSEKLYEFVLRHHQITTHLNDKSYTSKEDALWYQKFEELWFEVESTEAIFTEYFIKHVNSVTNVQKKIYDGFRKSLAKNRSENVTAQVIGEAVGEHLLRTARQIT